MQSYHFAVIAIVIVEMSILEHSDDSRVIGYFILPHKKLILLVDSQYTVH